MTLGFSELYKATAGAEAPRGDFFCLTGKKTEKKSPPGGLLEKKRKKTDRKKLTRQKKYEFFVPFNQEGLDLFYKEIVFVEVHIIPQLLVFYNLLLND